MADQYYDEEIETLPSLYPQEGPSTLRPSSRRLSFRRPPRRALS